MDIVISQLQINSEDEYDDRLKDVEYLMDIIDSGNNTVLPLLDYVSQIVEAYEDIHYPLNPSLNRTEPTL